MKVEDISASICGLLYDLGCKFHMEGGASHYIFVRKPMPMKIRVSDHRQHKREKGQNPMRIKEYRVGQFDMSLEDITSEIKLIYGQYGIKEI